MIRSKPCSACPYRKDCPSGVWAHSEYEKLREYDAETQDQPFAAFSCHATPEALCYGWVYTHDTDNLLGLRLYLSMNPDVVIPPPCDIPLFQSGNEAADHGQADIIAPTIDAKVTVDRLLRKYPRLTTTQE